MARGQGGARRPATKFAQLQKKLGRQNVQRNLQAQAQANRALSTSLTTRNGNSFASPQPEKLKLRDS